MVGSRNKVVRSFGNQFELYGHHGHLARADRRAELRQSRLADEHRFRCCSAGPPARQHIDHARSGVRAVLHCGCSRAVGEREALPAVAAKWLAPSLSARKMTLLLAVRVKQRVIERRDGKGFH